MFVSQAHSFKQQARLAITLAWVGGYVNIATVLSCGTVSSHMSGITSEVGREIVNGAWGLAGFALFLLGSFFVGAIVSGACTETGRRRGWESIYVLPIVVETVLLGIFAILLEIAGSGHTGFLLYWMTGLAAMAMGLQNATITRISSGVVRTTHVTGVLTDLGNELVQFIWWLFDRRRDRRNTAARNAGTKRLVLLLSILSSFALGAALATLAYRHFPRGMMFGPVAFLLWLIYQDFSRPIAELRAGARPDLQPGFAYPEALAVYHLRRDRIRRGKSQRMPNLLAWADRLPATVQVIILELSDVSQFDLNATMELRALLHRFNADHRHLIITGIDARQFQEMQLMDEESAVPVDTLCPTLEQAIAIGLSRIQSPGLPSES